MVREPETLTHGMLKGKKWAIPANLSISPLTHLPSLSLFLWNVLSFRNVVFSEMCFVKCCFLKYVLWNVAGFWPSGPPYTSLQHRNLIHRHTEHAHTAMHTHTHTTKEHTQIHMKTHTHRRMHNHTHAHTDTYFSNPMLIPVTKLLGFFFSKYRDESLFYSVKLTHH